MQNTALHSGLKKLRTYVSGFDSQEAAAAHLGIGLGRLRYLMSSYAMKRSVRFETLSGLYDKTGIEEFMPPVARQSDSWNDQFASFVAANYGSAAEASRRLKVPRGTVYRIIEHKVKTIDGLNPKVRANIFEGTGLDVFDLGRCIDAAKSSVVKPSGYKTTPIVFLSRPDSGTFGVYNVKFLSGDFESREFEVASAGYPHIISELCRSSGATVQYGRGFDAKNAAWFEAFLAEDRQPVNVDAEQQRIIDEWFARNGVSLADRIYSARKIAEENTEFVPYISSLVN